MQNSWHVPHRAQSIWGSTKLRYGRRSRKARGAITPKTLADTLTLFQSGEGVDYAHHITTPPPPDFQAFLRPWKAYTYKQGTDVAKYLREGQKESFWAKQAPRSKALWTKNVDHIQNNILFSKLLSLLITLLTVVYSMNASRNVSNHDNNLISWTEWPHARSQK